MSVTTANLAVELALATTETNIPQAMRTRLERILHFATTTCDGYAPNAPEATRDMAVIRLCGWMYNYDLPGSPSQTQNPFRQSGAQAMLATYRTQRAQVITPDDQNDGTPSQQTLPPLDQLTEQEIDARIQTWAQTGNVDPLPASKLTNVPSGSGVDQTARDAAATAQATANGKPSLNEVRDVVSDWAEQDNTDTIPASKLPATAQGIDQTARDAAAVAQSTANSKDDAYAWAEEGNIDAIPASKLTNAPAGDGVVGGFSPTPLTGSPSTVSVPNSGARTQLKSTGLMGWTGGTFVLLSGPVTAAGSNHRNYSAARWIPVADLEGLTPVLANDWVDTLRGHAFSASAAGTARGTNTSVILPSRVDQGAQATKADVFVARTSTNELLISVENFGTSHTFKAWWI